ncbi:MAG: amidohydrolase family protein [Caulobacteraceae bacterium]
MSKGKFSGLAVAAWVAAAGAAPAQPVEGGPVPPPEKPVQVIHAGHVIATPGEPALGPQTVVVRDGKIVSLEPGFRPAAAYGANARLIDLTDKTLLPGLIDLHMHIAIIMNADPATATSEGRLALASASYLRQLLSAGVTTIRDIGDNTGVSYILRDAVAQGQIPGPRIFAAGRIVSRTGGHGAEKPRNGDFVFTPAGCDGPESCRRVVRQNIEDGSDWIKVAVSGSGREATGQAGSAPIMFPDEVQAVTDAARQANIPVAAHAQSTASINLALADGVRTIEHGAYFDDASVKLFKARGAFLVPTVFVADYVSTQIARFSGGPGGVAGDALRQWTEAARKAPGRAWRAGVPLGLGTDSGPSFGPDATAREIGLYVASGVPAAQAIKAATTTNAEILGLEKEVGKVQPGYRADLIAVAGDPNQDVGRLRFVSFVMKDGEVHPTLLIDQ